MNTATEDDSSVTSISQGSAAFPETTHSQHQIRQIIVITLLTVVKYFLQFSANPGQDFDVGSVCFCPLTETTK